MWRSRVHFPRLRLSRALNDARGRRSAAGGLRDLERLAQYVQRAHAARGHAHQELLGADLEQHGALLGSERNVGEDVDGVADAAAEAAHAARQPGDREDRGEHGQQREA